jgi:hypothetical protein
MAYIRKQNPEELREELKKWRISKLKQVYIHHFILREKHPEIKSQLELISEVLSQKDFEDRLKIYRNIQGILNEHIRLEDYKNASVMQKMLEYYYMHVLD